ncbi:MAG: 16S rRNA (cytosine(1402)-N(4))-methyltransferase RsmH [Candidatus Pacebacteria bacterium]|nr:16S rRNA (cytosine(1402)-N(4))-methyltransferase RsmH [Candidatus Paceibacterota bacterium]MBP9843028.1 16S rRNA (cytosine(1402)-N(4))-methyltransferase RsmH [Candidatus Paceibacterota bacterium]
MQHITVLQQEAVDALSPSSSDIVVDATFGAGGHAKEIIKRLNTEGTYIGIDADETAFEGKTFTDAKPTIHLVNNNFRNITDILGSLHIKNVNAILADLGWRMEQFAEGGKGFSFMHDEPLHMTFGAPSQYEYTARDMVNEWGESSLADIIFGYGEERMARKIAKAIVTARRVAPIETTGQLVTIIESVFPPMHYRKVNPSTKTFQALRIAVNDELGALEQFLKDGFTALDTGGRMAIITFHSLEDRVVKHYFRTLKDAGLANPTTKKPIAPTREELSQNPRARSAKLRVITKL